MAQVITIIITESDDELVYGVPKYLTLDTNIPSTIYYTLDGSVPTDISLIYLGDELYLPTNTPTITIKLFATDGTDTSAVVTRTYYPDITSIRQSHDMVTDLGASTDPPNFPYGDPAPEVPGVYLTVGGDIVDSPDKSNYPSGHGWDGSGTGTGVGFTDQPLESYDIVFSEANDIGERGHGIGTVPATVTATKPAEIPISSNMNDRLFNPRALVIYQDNTKEPFDPNLCQVNRQYFSLENPQTAKDGAAFDTLGYEGLTATGSFVNSFFNPRDNTITYYYFDSKSLRWIISKESYQPTSSSGKLYNLIFSSRARGSQYVYKWIPFVGRILG